MNDLLATGITLNDTTTVRRFAYLLQIPRHPRCFSLENASHQAGALSDATD